MRIFKDRNINDILLVDNAAYSFGFQIDNGIPIVSFYNNKNDSELKDLTCYLKKISTLKNIIEINKEVFKLKEYGNFIDPVKLLQTLYLN